MSNKQIQEKFVATLKQEKFMATIKVSTADIKALSRAVSSLFAHANENYLFSKKCDKSFRKLYRCQRIADEKAAFRIAKLGKQILQSKTKT